MSGPGRHLILVGLMGTGKTAVGEACAGRLGRPFVDTDALVEGEAGATVAELFATEGETSFREREKRAVVDACAAPEPAVIACGGGAVLDPGNRRAMKDAGTVVWLTAPVEVLAARVGPGDGRPLLAGGAPATEVLARLADLRRPAFEAVADVVVDTAGADVDGVAAAVLEAAGPGFSRRKTAGETVESRQNGGAGT